MGVDPAIAKPREASAPASRKSGLGRRVLLAVGVCLFMLFLAEAALQLFYRVTVGQWLFTRTGLPLFVPDERFVYWNKPHMSFTHRTNEFTSEIATNGQGLRVAPGGKDFPLAKEPGTRRILLLGPSFAFGWGVDYEQTFAARLQELLNEGHPAKPDKRRMRRGPRSSTPACRRWGRR